MESERIDSDARWFVDIFGRTIWTISFTSECIYLPTTIAIAHTLCNYHKISARAFAESI